MICPNTIAEYRHNSGSSDYAYERAEEKLYETDEPYEICVRIVRNPDDVYLDDLADCVLNAVKTGCNEKSIADMVELMMRLVKAAEAEIDAEIDYIVDQQSYDDQEPYHD